MRLAERLMPPAQVLDSMAEAKTWRIQPDEDVLAFCGKEKHWRGGEGVFISGRCRMDRRQIELDENCGMILLCAFGGNRLQNGAGKIANGMSELENSLAGRA